MAILAMTALSTNASAGCITSAETAVLKHQAAIAGSVKVFVSHADLPLGTPVPVIQNATNERVAQLNSGGTEIFVTQSWVPAPAPGFEAFATAAGIEKLHQEEYCFGRIN
jgi:hypothetical protein